MDIKRLLWKTFSIHSDEYKYVFPLFLLYFLCGSFFASGQIYSETLFLKSYGAEGFAKFFVYNGFAIIISGLFYNYFLLKWPLRKGYLFLVTLITTLVISLIFIEDKEYAWLPFYIYMANYLFTFFLDIHFFNYAFQFLSIRNSKRILPVLMGAGKLGGIISSLLIFSIFSKDISKYGVYVWAFNGVLMLIPILLLRKSSLSEYEKANRKGHELLPDYKLIDRIIRKIKFSMSSPIFTYTVLAVLAMSVANQISEYYFAKIFNAAFPTKNELSSFLSLYTFCADFITLAFQFFIISRIIQFIGVQKSNLVYPISFFSFISLCIAFPGLIAGILIRFYRKNLSTIIRTPIFNIIMASSPRDRMIEVKSFISDIIGPIGMIAGGGAILLIYKKLTPMEGYIFALGIGVLFILFTFLQNKAYLKSLKNRLSFEHTAKEETKSEFEASDYESLLNDPKKIEDNIDAIEVIFNQKPTLELVPYLHLHFKILSTKTRENILNLLKSSRYEYHNEIITLGLQDDDPFIRGITLSQLVNLPLDERKNLLEITHPDILESEKYAISVLLAEGNQVDDGTIVDDFIVMRLLMIKNAVLSGEMDPIEFIIFIQVLPYQFLLEHLIELGEKTRDIQFLKSLSPYAYKLDSKQIRKILYTYKNAPMKSLVNFLSNAENARELDKTILLNRGDIHEDHMKKIFKYDEELFYLIIRRLFKNKSSHAKSNYLKYILTQNKKPTHEMDRFIDFQVKNIQNLNRFKYFIGQLIQDTTDKNLIKLTFIDFALQDTIDICKHLILKAIAIISGFKVDEIHDSNILLRDKDINNYILEYIESTSSIKNKKKLLSIFEDISDSMKNPQLKEEPYDEYKNRIKRLWNFIPEISEFLKFCLSDFIKVEDIKDNNDTEPMDIEDKKKQEEAMLSTLEKIIFLKKNKLFGELKLSDIIHIAKIAKEIEVPGDKRIIRQGEKGTQLFILLNGEVQVYTDDRVLANLGPGSCIGELSIIDEEPRSANVKTIQKTKILSINRNDFLLTLKENPTISINIMQVITDRLRGLIK